MAVFGFSGKDVRRVRKAVHAFERTPRAADDARPGNAPLRGTGGREVFRTPAGGIPGAASDVKPSFASCERWYFDPTAGEFKPTGVYQSIMSRSKTQVPANVLITAVSGGGYWEMVVLLCDAKPVTGTPPPPSTGTSPSTGTGPNSGGAQVGGKINSLAAGVRSGHSPASTSTGAGASTGTGGGIRGTGGPPPP